MTDTSEKNNAAILAHTLNFTPYDEMKTDSWYVENGEHVILLAKQKHACNIRIRFNMTELQKNA